MKKRTVIKLLVGLAINKPDLRFLQSLSTLLSELGKKPEHYKVEVLEVKDKTLVEAQNQIGNYFVEHDFDYLLFFEDDNWGFTLEYLKALLRLNTSVSSMHYYSRHFPYYSCLMRIQNPDIPSSKYCGYNTESGSHEVDMSGFGMMLIKRQVFNKLDKPYFRINEYGGPGCYATDQSFSEDLLKIGIKPVGCFDYCLGHRDVTPENVMELRIAGIRKNREALLKERGVGI
jgi:hypothetical protein